MNLLDQNISVSCIKKNKKKTTTTTTTISSENFNNRLLVRVEFNF